MALKLLIGGVDYTSRWRPEQSRWTMRAHLVESVSSSFVLDDFAGDLDHADIVPTKIVEVTEDASGSEVWLYRGRVTNKSLGRGPSRVNPAMRWTITADDANIEPRGMRVVDLDLDEQAADVRVKAIRNRYLDGASSTSALARTSTLIEDTYILATSPVVLPATAYELTYPDAVLQEIAEDTGFQVFVYLELDGTLALYFGGYVETSVLQSDVEINDDGSADGEDVFAPYYSTTTAEHAGQRVLTGGGIQYGDDGRYYEDSDIGGAESVYDKWEEHLVNEHVENDLQAQRHLNNTVALAIDQASYVATIDMRADQVHRLRAGQMVMLKQLASDKPSLGFQRASQVTVEPQYPDANGDATFRVTAELGRPRARPTDLRIRRRPLRFRPSADPSPAYITGSAEANDSADTELPLTVNTADRFLLAFIGTNNGAVTSVEWYQSVVGGEVGADASPEAFTLIDDGPASSDHDVEAWGLVDPDLSTDVDSQVTASHPDGRNAGAVLMYSGTTGATVADRVRDTASDTGTGTAPSVTLSGLTQGDIAVAALSYHHGGSGSDDTAVTTPAGWNPRVHADKGPPLSSTHDAGIDVVEVTVGASGSVTATWTLSTSRQWTAMIVALKGPGGGGATPSPIGPSGGGSAGESGNPSRDDHTHEHPFIGLGGPYHEANDVTIADGSDLFTATTVEAALAELATALPSGEFVTSADGGQHQLNTVAASGSSETLDLADGNVHDVTLTDDCTFTFAGAAGGVGLQFWLIMRQDGTGGWVPTFPGSVIWPNDTEPTWSTDPGAVDVVEFLSDDGGATWFGDAGGSGSFVSATIWRPVMAFDVGDDHWYVVVDGDGTAVMAEG